MLKAVVRDLLVGAGWFVTGDVWAIALYEGASPVELGPRDGRDRPALTAGDVTDADAVFVADPFLVRESHGWRMFFEVLDRRSGRGVVGTATSPDGERWRYDRVVLAEPFHLSYPQVVAWRGEHYLVPETSAQERVLLYRAHRYPFDWQLTEVILEGRPFSDTTLLHHGECWYAFTETAPDLRSDTLRLYVADDLRGPWREHPASPLVHGDPVSARPAGRVVADGERLYRYAQDCTAVYGRAVRAFAITRLTPREYAEHPVGPVLEPRAHGWNDRGMHHVDAHALGDGRWLACVDGRPSTGPRLPDRWTAHYRDRRRATARRT